MFENGEYFRVTRDDYDTLLAFENDFDCMQETVTSPVCLCAQGYSGSVCATAVAQSCYVNITDPPLWQGCEDRPDTDFYMYSLGGFAPCYTYDFTQTYDFKLLIQCKVLTDTTT